MAVKMNLKIIMKNHAADRKIGFLAKSISKSKGCATAIPTAWELILKGYQFGIRKFYFWSHSLYFITFVNYLYTLSS